LLHNIDQSSAGAAEIGVGSGLSLSFNTSVQMAFACITVVGKSQSNTVGTGGLLAINTANTSWRGRTTQVSLELTWDGKVSVWIDGTLLFDQIQLPAAFLQQDLSTWNHVIRGATGAANDIHAIDNLSIAQGYGLGKYIVRAANSLGTHSSSLDLSVGSLPTVTTIKVDEVTFNSAKVDFNTLFTGGLQISKQGVIWGTSPELNLSNAVGRTEELITLDTLSSALSDLTDQTTYYFRAYAENALGVAYGDELSFKTPLTPPSVAYDNTTIILKKDQSATVSVSNSGGEVPSQFPDSVTYFGGFDVRALQMVKVQAAKFDFPGELRWMAAGNVYVADAI
jgi:hypothetical protein